MDLSTEQLLALALDAAAVDQAEPASALGPRIMEQALASGRSSLHPGWTEWTERAGARLSALDAFSQTASELAALIDSLTPDEWTAPTTMDGATVREVVEHLVGVQRYTLGQLGRRPPAAGRPPPT